jgi:hypothetical protein
LSEAQQIDFIEKIDPPDLPSNDMPISEGDPFVLFRNIDTRFGLVKGRRYHAIQIKNRTVAFQFEDRETRVLTRISMEKTSNGMKFIRCQLPLRLIFAGTVHKSQGMTLRRAVIDYRTKFSEHTQLYVAFSRVKSPVDLCILLPDDTDDFAIRPSVDLDVIQILETMESSKALPIPQILPGDNVESGVGSIDPSDAALAKELPCPDDYVDAPEDQIDCVPSLDRDAVEISDPCPNEKPLNVQIMSWVLEDQQVLQFNFLRDTVPQSYISGFLCLLRRFSIGYFKPDAQNSCQLPMNDYHSVWNNNS